MREKRRIWRKVWRKISLLAVVLAVCLGGSVVVDNLLMAPRIAVETVPLYVRAEGWQREWLEREIPEAEWPIVYENPDWEVLVVSRLTACDNRPGYGRIYLWALDWQGGYLGQVEVGYDTRPSEGIAYDHPNIFGTTGTKPGNLGYIEWEHLKIPTEYRCFVQGALLIDHLTTALGNEYCNPGSVVPWNPGNWRPVNRPGIYSFRIVIQKVGP